MVCRYNTLMLPVVGHGLQLKNTKAMNNRPCIGIIKTTNPKKLTHSLTPTTMDVQAIIAQLKDKFGDSFDISKVTEALKSIDLKNISFPDIVSKLHADGLLKNVDLGAAKDGLMDQLKSKAGGMLGGMFGK